jgi:hypothetical protein
MLLAVRSDQIEHHTCQQKIATGGSGICRAASDQMAQGTMNSPMPTKGQMLLHAGMPLITADVQWSRIAQVQLNGSVLSQNHQHKEHHEQKMPSTSDEHAAGPSCMAWVQHRYTLAGCTGCASCQNCVNQTCMAYIVRRV